MSCHEFKHRSPHVKTYFNTYMLWTIPLNRNFTNHNLKKKIKNKQLEKNRGKPCYMSCLLLNLVLPRTPTVTSCHTTLFQQKNLPSSLWCLFCCLQFKPTQKNRGANKEENFKSISDFSTTQFQLQSLSWLGLALTIPNRRKPMNIKIQRVRGREHLPAFR